MNKITKMKAMDLENIAKELKPDCKLTRNIIFLLYQKYGNKVVEEYINTFKKENKEKWWDKLSYLTLNFVYFIISNRKLKGLK